MERICILQGSSPQAITLGKILGNTYSIVYHKNYNSSLNIFKRYRKKEYANCDYSHLKDLKNYDYIIPTGAQSTYKYLKLVDTIKYKNNFVLDSGVLICYEKIKLLEHVERLNIPVPRTFVSKNDIKEKEYPIFYKKSFESGGGIRGIANNVNEIPDDGDLIYQEYINSNITYGVGFLSQKGDLVTHFIHRELLSIPPQGGSGVIVEEYHDDALVKYTKRIIKSLNYNGWGLAEYKYCPKRKDYIFMEVNAKWWASCYFHFINNPDFVNIPFDININPQKTKRMVFLNRIMRLNPFITLKNVHFLRNSKVVVEYPLYLDILFFIKKIIKSLK